LRILLENDMPQGIYGMLAGYGLPNNASVKVVRHKDRRCDVHQLTRRQFETGYQAYQARDIFNCDYIIACLGLPRLAARFIGVYRVMGKRPARDVPPPKDFPFLDILFRDGVAGPDEIWYDLARMPQFEALEYDVVIDWGRNPIVWAQWISAERDKPVLAMAEGFENRKR